MKRASFQLNKCNNMEYNHNFLYKIPVNISFMKFSTAVEEMAEEEEPSSLHSYERQVRMAGLAWNHGLSRTPANRKFCAVNKMAWAEATNKLCESKKIINELNKFDRNSSSSYESNKFASNGREAVYKIRGYDLELHGHREPASSSVSNSSKVWTDAERVGTPLNVSSVEISEETVARICGNHGLNTTGKAATNATSTRQACGTDKSKLQDRLCSIYEDILVVDNVSLAEKVAKMLTVNYRHLIHACDTEV